MRVLSIALLVLIAALAVQSESVASSSSWDEVAEETVDNGDERVEGHEQPDVPEGDDAEQQDDVEDQTQDSDSDNEMEDMSRKIRATSQALGADGGRYRAPAIIPRGSMDEFARELNRIKARLTRIVNELGPRIKRAHERMDVLKKKVEAEEANVSALKKKIREHIRKAKEEIKTKYAKEIAALNAKLVAYKKSREWLSALDGKVDVLQNGTPGVAEYELALADVKKSIAENSDTAEDMLGMDVVTELQNLETSRSMFDADIASDLEVGSLKMYETTRLRHLTKRMHKSLDKKILKAEKKLADIHKVEVPKHLHLGLRRAKRNLKLLKQEVTDSESRYARLRRVDIPKEAAAKRELEKIDRIERHIYTARK